MTARPTSLRPAVRRIAVTLALFTGVASAATATAPHASAVGREERTITRTQGMDEGYGPLSAGSSTTPDPAVCLAAGFCDTIPVEIVPPDIPLGDDYYVQFDITWDQPELYDLDVYIFDDGQTQEEARANGTSDPTKVEASPYTQKGSNTNDNPASLVVAEPRLGRYNLVVNNASLSDVSYHVKAQMVIAKFKKPFESLEDPDSFVTDEDDEDPPVDTSGDTPAPAPVTNQDNLDFGSDTPVLDEVDPGVDSELEALRNSKKKKDDGDGEAAGVLNTSNSEPPGPPSGLALLFWLAVVPGSMLGGMAFWLVKRRRSGFTFG